MHQACCNCKHYSRISAVPFHLVPTSAVWSNKHTFLRRTHSRQAFTSWGDCWLSFIW